jgi:hypothetical protein
MTTEGCGLVAAARLVASSANSIVIIGTYLEYLWASEWVDNDRTCRSAPLGFLDILDCLRRFTYSDSMVRGNNLFWFTIVGSFAAAVYVWAEHRRTQSLKYSLENQRSALDSHGASKLEFSIKCLTLYKATSLSSYVFVLGLAYCHIDRPLLHYPLAGTMFLFMSVAMSSYMLMPLDFGVDTTDEVRTWSRRRQKLLPWMRLLCAVQVATLLAGIFRVFAVVSVATWSNTSGRIFGILEVSVILGFQIWVMLFTSDDVHMAGAPGVLQSLRKSDIYLRKSSEFAIMSG